MSRTDRQVILQAALVGMACLLLVALYTFAGVSDYGYAGELARGGRSAFAWLWARWREPGFEHGAFIPLASLWLLWRRREALRQAMTGPVPWGLVLVGMAGALHWAGLRIEQVRVSLFGFGFFVYALAFTLGGVRFARFFVFPLVYLLFALPWYVLDTLSFPLRLLAAGSSTALLNGIGIEAVRRGSGILLRSGTIALDVADPCSGMHSLLAVTALAAAYAYVLPLRRAWKAILFLSCVPIAIVGNILRVLLIAVVAYAWSNEAALRLYHDWSGYAVFLVALLLLQALGDRFRRFAAVPHGAENSIPANAAVGRRRRMTATVLGVLGMVLFAAVAAVVELNRDRPALPEPVVHLPADLGAWHGMSIRYCQSVRCGKSYVTSDSDVPGRCAACSGELGPLSVGERSSLPPDTFAVRRLYRRGHEDVWVSVIGSGRQRSSIHRPEMCVRGLGYRIADAWTREAAAGDKPLPVRVLVLDAEGGSGRWPAPTSFYAYWFTDAHTRTASNMRRLLAEAFGRLSPHGPPRWFYVAVAGTGDPARPDVWALIEQFAGAGAAAMEGAMQKPASGRTHE